MAAAITATITVVDKQEELIEVVGAGGDGSPIEDSSNITSSSSSSLSESEPKRKQEYTDIANNIISSLKKCPSMPSKIETKEMPLSKSI